MSMGLATAYGIEGGYEALHDIISRRKKDELLAQKAEEERQRQELAVQQLQESERHSRFSEQQQGLQTEAMIGQRHAQEAALESQTQDRAHKQQYVDEAIKRIMASPDYTDKQKTLAVMGLQSGTFDPSDLLKAPQRTDEEEIAYQARMAGEKAKAEWPYKTHGTEGKSPADYFTPVPFTGSPTGLAGFSARTNKIVLPELPAGFEGGLAGPAAKEAISKVKGIDDALSNLDAMESIGNKHGWKGTGPLGNVRGMLSGAGLVPDPEGDAVRAAAEYVGALTNHPLFGSAFTETEKSLMKNFSTSASTVGSANLTRIAVMREILQKGRERRLQGLDASGAHDTSGAGAGAGAGSAPHDPFGMLNNPLFK